MIRRAFVLGALLLLALGVLAFLWIARPGELPWGPGDDPSRASRTSQPPVMIPADAPPALLGAIPAGSRDADPRGAEGGAARDHGIPAAPGSEMGDAGELVLVEASADRVTYEVGEPVRVRRVFENPTERPIQVGTAGWRQRLHSEVVLLVESGARLYEPPTAQVPEIVVAPHGRVVNELEVELRDAGDWTIQIPPAYQARPPQRPCFNLQVTVLDRGDARHLAAKAERLARTIQTEDPACPTCWSEAQKELAALGAAAVLHLRLWLAGADSAYLRAVSAKILGPLVIHGADGREELLAGLSHADADVRRMCVAALQTAASAETLGALLPMMRDRDRWVRVDAIQAVAESDDARVLPALVASLDDEDGNVRQWVAMTLAEKGNATGIRVLLGALEADPTQNAFLVVKSLEKLTGLSFGQAGMPFVHSFEDQIDEAIAANKRVAERWLEWWKTEGARRYGH
jgi:hypothetical protein